MKSTLNYIMTYQQRAILFLISCVLAFVIAFSATGRAADQPITCWILCQPGSQVNVRRTPEHNGQIVGFLETGDEILTDAESSGGWIRVYGVGEYGEGWVYCGYVATEEPVPVFDTYVCVAKNRVACRRWIDGPQTSLPWLVNGSDVQVFYIAGDWAITARGYIRSEYLEADPQ